MDSKNVCGNLIYRDMMTMLLTMLLLIMTNAFLKHLTCASAVSGALHLMAHQSLQCPLSWVLSSSPLFR